MLKRTATPTATRTATVMRFIRFVSIVLGLVPLAQSFIQQVQYQERSAVCMQLQDDENGGCRISSPSLEGEQHSRREFLTAAFMVGAIATSASETSQAAEVSTTTTTDPSSNCESSSLSTADSAAGSVDWQAILKKSSKKALGGGKAGAAAAVIQVCSLMWLRTSMNYQYRYGGNLQSSLKTLWEEGGIGRLYQGLPFALIQGPLTRFGDTAANVGILALLEGFDETRGLPLPFKTACGSAAAGLWRILLMPVDASKTAMQVEGADGLERLWSSVTTSGPGVLYRGAFAQAAATAVGHFPWFATYNFLDAQLPLITPDMDLFLSLLRSAVMGLSASCVSDCCSNSLRVIKTTKQTAQLSDERRGDDPKKELSYPEVVALIVEKDGLVALFGRGLQTRLITNAIQGMVFSVLWKYFQQSGLLQ